MVSVDKRIWNLPVHLVLMFQHFPLYIPGLTLSSGGSLILLYWISMQACLQSACIPASHLSRHKHAHILTSVQYERGLSQAGSHDLSDTGSLVNGHPPAGKMFKVLLFNDIDKHTQRSTCPFSASVLSWRQEASKTLHSVALPHSSSFLISLSLEMQNTAKHASLQFNPCLKPLVLRYYWCANW